MESIRAPGIVKQIRLEVFKNCPAHCSHCYQAQSPGIYSRPSPLFQNEVLYKKLIEDFVSLGGKSVSITGGEFLMPERWYFASSFLKYLVEAGIKEIRINSILAFATPEIISQLGKLVVPNLIIQTGIDGEIIHDRLRFDGALRKTLDVVMDLHQVGISNISARATIFFDNLNKSNGLNNLNSLTDILRLCENYKIKRLKTKLLHYTGRTRNDRIQFEKLFQDSITTTIPNAFMRLVEFKEHESMNVKLLFTKPLPDNFMIWIRDYIQAKPDEYKVESCACGNSHLAIDADGNVFRCLYNFGKPQLNLGNLFDKTYTEITGNKTRMSYVRHQDEPQLTAGCSSFRDNLLYSPETLY